MSYSERAFAGPDASGRTYPAEPVAHCAAKAEHERLERLSPRRARHQWTEEPPVPEQTPTYTLDRQIAEWRAEVSEERYRQVQREWRA